MKLEMTELGPVKRALKIEIPEDAVNQEFQKVYSELRKQARVPGFRPGKAPVSVLEQRYAKLVAHDVVQRLVPDYYQRAVKEAGVTPVVVDIPPLERLKVRRNESFTFTATVDIKPVIELGDYRPPNPLSLKQDARTVSDEQVDQALNTLREQHGRVDAASEGATAEAGMIAVLSIEGRLEDQPVEGTQKSGHMHTVGEGTPVLGVDIDPHITGKPSGADIEIPQDYPAQHPDERLAGKTVTFHVHIDALKEKRLPDLDDEFAKDCGDYDTLDHLRTSVREQLEAVLKRDVEDGYKEQVIDRLVTMHHFDIPEPLIDRELQTMVRQRMLREHRHDHKDHGDLDEPAKLQAEAKRLHEELLPEAKKRVKLGLILERISEKEGLHVSDQDVDAELARISQSVKLPVEEVRRMVDAGGQSSWQEFKERMLAEQALQRVYEFSVIQG